MLIRRGPGIIEAVGIKTGEGVDAGGKGIGTGGAAPGIKVEAGIGSGDLNEEVACGAERAANEEMGG